VNKTQVKLFSSLNADAFEFVPIFHRWIRDHQLDELLIDVVDYSHVRHGPEVVLIGHESDYAIDRTLGKLGLLYTQKRLLDAPDNPWLAAIKRALHACVLLQSESGPTTPLAFRTDEMTLRVADRLLAPNTDVTFDRLLPEINGALRTLFGATAFSLGRTGSSRELFAVEVHAPEAPPPAELLRRLAFAPTKRTSLE
jgi:hypothetical protein